MDNIMEPLLNEFNTSKHFDSGLNKKVCSVILMSDIDSKS